MEVDPQKLYEARMRQPRASFEVALRQTAESLRRSREQGFEGDFDCVKIAKSSESTGKTALTPEH